MTREEIENRLLPLRWEYQTCCEISPRYLAKTGLDFNLRVAMSGYADCTLLLKEDLNGRRIESIELDSQWKAYKLARIWQINKLCEILQIRGNIER